LPKLLQMDLEKIKPSIATTIVLCVSVFFLVVLSFFLLSRRIFISLDNLKLTGVCLGISLAILALNRCWVSLLTDETPNQTEKEVEEDELTQIVVSSFCALVVLGGNLLYCYYYSISIKGCYWRLFFTDNMVFIIIFISKKIVRRK